MQIRKVREVAITADNLPKGPRWDMDGDCYTACKSDIETTGVEWRWMPNNWKAFAKGEPNYPLYEYAPFKI